jgi:putative transcriptional regulator
MLPPAWGQTQALPPQFEAGILVASPGIADPNFAHSVVLVTQTPVGEIIGLVLNRPLDAPWPSGILTPEQSAGRHLHFGGPLIPAATLSVGAADTPVADTQDLGGGLRFAIGLKNTRALAVAGGQAPQLKLFRGYAGWGPGQLEAEVAAGVWQLRELTPELVFDPEPATQWERLTALSRAVRAAPLPLPLPRHNAGLDLRKSMRLIDFTRMSCTSVPCSTLSGTAAPATPAPQSFL